MLLEEAKQIYLDGGTEQLVFISTPELFSEIKSTYDTNSLACEREVLEHYQRAHLLVLDDFGTIKPTDWVLQTLYLIINYRYENLKKTIFHFQFTHQGSFQDVWG